MQRKAFSRQENFGLMYRVSIIVSYNYLFFVIQFIAVSGDAAVRARNYGSERLLNISHKLESIEDAFAQASNSLTDLITCLESLLALQTEVDGILGGGSNAPILPFLDRCALERHQESLPRLLGRVRTAARNASNVPANVDPIMFGQLSRSIEEASTDRTDSSSPIVGSFNISSFNKV